MSFFFKNVKDKVYRDPNVPKKTKDLMLITYLNPTYLWCFLPDPGFRGAVLRVRFLRSIGGQKPKAHKTVPLKPPP